MSLNDVVAANIKKVRIAHGFSQNCVSRKTGIPSNTISRMENGVYKITLDRLENIAWALDLPVQAFLSKDLRCEVVVHQDAMLAARGGE